MQEIERKFLIDTEKWKPGENGVRIVQAYLSTHKDRVVRVRIKGEKAFLTVKGNPKGIARTELEYEIGVKDAELMLKMCLDYPIEKTRYYEKVDGLLWEIDVFHGLNEGLFLAEVELEYESQKIELPNWIVKEVSEDHRYFNAWLSENPFKNW